jgi:hypothetical protein
MSEDQKQEQAANEAEAKSEASQKRRKPSLKMISSKGILDGTVRIGASFGEVFANMGDIFSGREHVLMVRVNDATLEKVDQLVESGMFKSRSESAAYLIAKGINADYELFGKISEKVSQINKLRDELKDIVVGDEEGTK